MARYIGTLTSDARGKIGGIVMTRARNGTNLKAHGVGVNVRSSYQLSLRQTFASALVAWKTTIAPGQTTWALLAAQYTYVNSLGQPYTPTGLQLFTQAYMNAMLSGTAPPVYAPTSPPYINQIVSLAVARAGASLVIDAFQSGGGYYSGAYTASLSSVLPSTRNYTKPVRRRPMGFTLTGPAITCTAAYLAAYGRIPLVDDYLSIRAVPFDPVSFISAAPVLAGLFVT